MRRHQCLGYLAVLVMVCAALGGGNASALPADNGPIVYDGLNVVSAQGTIHRRLPLHRGAVNPVFSPDGKHILFSKYSPESDTWQLYLTDRGGRRSVLLTGATGE